VLAWGGTKISPTPKREETDSSRRSFRCGFAKHHLLGLKKAQKILKNSGQSGREGRAININIIVDGRSKGTANERSCRKAKGGRKR
jgi:hypothetical protein